MSLATWIQSRPPHVRMRIAFGVAAGVTTLVTLVWFTTIPAKFGNISGKAYSNGVAPAFQDVVTGVTQQQANVIGSGATEPSPAPTTNLGALSAPQGGVGVEGAAESEPVAPTPPPDSTPTESSRVILIGTTTTSSTAP